MMRNKFSHMALAAAALILSACGFKPLHATGEAGSNLSNLKVDMAHVQDVQDREAGFYMEQRLRDRIGVNDDAAHIVTITPNVRRRSIGVTSNDVASRYDILLRAKYTLTEANSGKIIETGNVEATSTFGAPDDPYGLIAADTNGTKQGAKELADRLILQLATFYSQQRALKAAP